jgi:hypothetical protein
LRLKDELANYKVFDRLNSERITPFFMKLVKTQNSTPDITQIRGDNGQNLTESELEKHVTGFYERLYDFPKDANGVVLDGEVTQDNLKEFLGPVQHHAAVVNAKITDMEKTTLENPLSLQEFDKAIRQSNKKSAPGTDGLNNKFIEHFWKFFRVPLIKYANCCYDKGELTTTFKTAKIRLIPKKGNVARIENWRPISLLNCFYKLISRVLTNRLKKVSDKITAVGQYGYAKNKQCQEVLIGLLNKIHAANKNYSKGLLVSLDIKKAFDSISHSYMEQVLKFFNFGDSFIKWVKLICR